MEQMLHRICYAEESWLDSDSVFARPEKLRLRQQLRSCKIKCDLADDLPAPSAVCMLQALQQKAENNMP
eukprot:6186801-Pleurochrysis_carterae.AAC.2